MVEEMGYASVLRPIGQMLENLRIESFSVWPDGDGFMVRDRSRNWDQLTPTEKSFDSELQSANDGSTANGEALRLAAGIVEWRLARADIEQLELDGRERRRNPNGIPSAHAISQLLRVIGGVVDQRLGRLLSVTSDGQHVTLGYLSSGGQTVTNDYTIPTLYDFWVRMYKKRSSIDS